jgi:ATP-dependent Lon protease
MANLFYENNVPVLPIRNTVVFPGGTLPLRVGRTRSVAAVEAAQARRTGGQDAWILLVPQSKKESDADRRRPGFGEEGPEIEELHKVGVLANILRLQGSATDGYQIVVRSLTRFRVDEFRYMKSGAIEAVGSVVTDKIDADPETLRALESSVRKFAEEIIDLLPGNTQRLKTLVSEIKDLTALVDLCAGNLDITDAEKLELLEELSLKDRTLKLLDHLQKQKQKLEVQGEIREKLSHKLGKAQRDALLREQIRTIRQELGEEEDENERDDLRKKIEEAGMPDDVKKQALDELKRLESMGNNSPETHVIRTYIDWLIAMPWSKSSQSDLGALDLVKARESLDADHFGLDRVKKRILQHLAVMKLRQDKTKGSILLLVGPPGVGKTSLGQSVAKVLGRKFIRASLGGVRDESEIRGHRRTYVGAMPGRIVQAIKRAGENDPLMLLDEIDKLGRGWAGDPSAALLEVLDPEQNSTFVDHYLDVPFDLSKVFFVATANSLEGIPAPLLDRMEVIELTGYTVEEKLHIAKNHLIPKQLAEHGLKPEQVELSDEMLRKLMLSYTRESGVRELQRRVAGVCRAVAEKLLITKDAKVVVDEALLEDSFGQERYTSELLHEKIGAGVVTGLAWTPVGGEILFVEAARVPGSGKLTITGQLGDVMKESAQIAVSLVRKLLGSDLDDPQLSKTDLHIHVPSGAIPKDGPSAGVTLTTALASLMLGKPVDPRLAMTGEITLRGAVTAVGGIKEKVLAAHRMGVKKVLLSKRNERDLKELPEDVRKAIQFITVENIAEVLKHALNYDVLPMDHVAGAPNGPRGAPMSVASQ